ncbi:MAG: leucyl aminopeptidase family protein [Acetobacteraceae bacterium]
MGDADFDRELDCLASADAAALPVVSVRPEGLDAALGALVPEVAGFVRAGGFTGEAGQLTLLPGGSGLAGAMLGLGADRSPWAHGALPMALPEAVAWRLEPGAFDMEAAVLGFCLGAYQYTRLTRPKRRPARLAGVEAFGSALAIARAAWLARDLINTPANLLGPAELAAATLALGRRFGAEGHLTEGAALQEEYPAVAAVGRGAERAPVVAAFVWTGSGAGPGAKHISLCGKGVCFDSGGYDLKPPTAMLRMKKDMGGAALMLALASAVMQADLPVRLTVRVGCVENMVSGGAMRPLDVLRTRRGLSVEVGNTDAEGRLVLCDLLAEASDEGPDLLIDAATLTGAARVALGPDLPGLFSPDDALAEAAMRAGDAAHDPVWRLPLYAGYDPWLASPTADLNNVTANPYAGAIIAGLFLQRFVAPGTAWVHLDTYAWNDQARPGRPEGGEALGLRALLGVVTTLIRV